MTEFFEWRDAPPAQYAVIGDPVSHSLSPKMQNAAFRAAGIEAGYVAIRVPRHEFSQAMAHIELQGYIGVNVTVPLKDLAYEWAKHVPMEVHEFESVNTVRFKDRTGTNTDAVAIQDILDGLCEPSSGRPAVLVLGAGGTALAFTSRLSHAGYRVCAWNRTKQRLVEGLEHFRKKIEVRDLPDPSGCRFILNATSSSMQNESLPVLWDRASPHAIAIDCYYADDKTVFQIAAERQGLKSQDGRMLLVRQGAKSFEWWTGIDAPIEAMLSAIHED